MSRFLVQNILSPRSNMPIINQFVIITEEGRYFQSYETMVAYHSALNIVYLNKDCYERGYSNTTSKYLSVFLDVNAQTIRNRVASGTYLLIDMNGGT